MLRGPPQSTRSDPLFPYSTCCRTGALMGKQVKAPYGVYEVLSAEYQRNGGSGIGFFVGLVLCVEGDYVGETLHIVTLYSRDSEAPQYDGAPVFVTNRSEEHTSELQSLMRPPYAVLLLNKKNK